MFSQKLPLVPSTNLVPAAFIRAPQDSNDPVVHPRLVFSSLGALPDLLALCVSSVSSRFLAYSSEPGHPLLTRADQMRILSMRVMSPMFARRLRLPRGIFPSLTIIGSSSSPNFLVFPVSSTVTFLNRFQASLITLTDICLCQSDVFTFLNDDFNGVLQDTIPSIDLTNLVRRKATVPLNFSHRVLM